MDHRVKSTTIRSRIPVTSECANKDKKSAIDASSMAPIVIEEDENICSAAIITLGGDSDPSEDGKASIAPVDCRSPSPSQSVVEDEQEEVTVLRVGESEHDVLERDDLMSRDSEGSENGSGSGGSLEEEDEQNLSDATVLFVEETEECIMEFEEIHLTSDSGEGSSGLEGSDVQIKTLETMEMIETTTQEQMLIDLSEATQRTVDSAGSVGESGSESSLLTSPVRKGWAYLSFDNDLDPGEASDVNEFRGKAPITLQQELEDEASERGLLDSPVMKDFVAWDTSNNLQPEPASRINGNQSRAPITMKQELEDATREADNDQDSEDSFQSFDSDDEDEKMEPGDRTLWKELKRSNWVSGDLSMILDPAADEKIHMPVEFQGRKRALMQLFLLLSRVVFFIDLGVRRDRIFKLIPEKFWLQHFTWTDTRQLFEVRDKELCINLLSRTKTVLEEWRLSCRFPRVPETLDDVKEASGVLRKGFRENRVEGLLSIKSYKSDRWLTHIFLDFVDCLPWLDVLEADAEIRKAAIKKVITMSELCFKQPISIVEEFQEVNMRRESMGKVVQDQLNIVPEKTERLTLVG